MRSPRVTRSATDSPPGRDIALLVASNKALRREVQALRVRSWRDAESAWRSRRNWSKPGGATTPTGEAGLGG
jgi:hypothetical protein